MKQSLRLPVWTPPVIAEMDATTKYPIIACVWWGDKYGIEYVQRLKAACDRNMPQDVAYEFHVLTDRLGHTQQLHDEGMNCHSVWQDWPGWWQKVCLFDPVLWGRNDRVLMLDLDIVVTGPLIDMFRSSWHTTAIANFGMNFRTSKYNSSAVLFNTDGPAGAIYDDFLDTGPEAVMKELHGDQCWMWRVMGDSMRVWPAGWVQSYKYDLRDRARLKPETRAVVFHGDPKPDAVSDQFVIDHWLGLESTP